MYERPYLPLTDRSAVSLSTHIYTYRTMMMIMKIAWKCFKSPPPELRLYSIIRISKMMMEGR